MKKVLCLSALIVYIFACCPSATRPPTPIAEPPTAQPPAVPPEPMDTSQPPPPPTEAPTLTPALLTCEDIEKKHKELTDLQWEAYRQEVVGERIRFAGEVIEVYDDGSVHINEGKGLFTVCVLYEVPRDTAITLTKGQFVQGEGTVREVDTFLGLTVRINVELLQSPTETTILTDTPAPSRLTAKVIAPTLNVRAGPGTDYSVVGKLSLDDSVEVLGKNDAGDWLQIVYPVDSDGRAWIATAYAELTSSLATVPEVSAPPPPEPAAAPTPTEVSALAETPAPAAPRLEILSSQDYVDDIGWLHIIGEVRNNSDTPMEFVKIVATLYDDASQVIGTGFTYTEIDVILPGGKSPFEIGIDQHAGTTQYKLQVQGDPGTLPRQDFVILSHNHYIDDIDWLHVQGEVQNTGDTPAEFVKIVVTLYDAAGNVVGTSFTYTELDVVSPGGISPFETVTGHWPNFDHYEIQVQAQ